MYMYACMCTMHSSPVALSSINSFVNSTNTFRQHGDGLLRNIEICNGLSSSLTVYVESLKLTLIAINRRTYVLRYYASLSMTHQW